MAEVASSNALREAMNAIQRNINTNKSKLGADAERLIMETVRLPEIGNF